MSFEDDRRSDPGRCQNVRYVERPSSDPHLERVERAEMCKRYYEERDSLDRPDSVPNQGTKHYENTTWYVHEKNQTLLITHARDCR